MDNEGKKLKSPIIRCQVFFMGEDGMVYEATKIVLATHRGWYGRLEKRASHLENIRLTKRQDIIRQFKSKSRKLTR